MWLNLTNSLIRFEKYSLYQQILQKLWEKISKIYFITFCAKSIGIGNISQIGFDNSFQYLIKLSEYYIAKHAPNEKIKSGTRIIARQKQHFFPCNYNDANINYLIINDDKNFYAGMVSDISHFENERFNYLLFFDDGHIQYVSSKYIRIVEGEHKIEHVDENAKKIYRYYFIDINKYKLHEIQPEVNKTIRVFDTNDFADATIIKVEEKMPRIIQVHFKKANKIEWLYTGSPRIEVIWRKIVKNANQVATLLPQTVEILSSDSEDENDEDFLPEKLPPNAVEPKVIVKILKIEILIRNLKATNPFKTHDCCNDCVREFEANKKIFDFSL